LEDIYMILTPLHSQNFIDTQGGVLTNNRRLVTKTMWFNGTAISNKAQRALRNENVTIVAHSSGYIHCLYEDATIDKELYRRFAGRLDEYLTTDLSLFVFASFLRTCHEHQKFFQVCCDCHGQAQFVKAEVLFHYEHGSNHRVGDKTLCKLLAEVSDEDFVRYQLPGRIRCDELEEFIEKERPDLRRAEGKSAFRRFVEPVVGDVEQLVDDLADFLHTEAKLPALDKNFVPADPVGISVGQSRREIIEHLQQERQNNYTADLAFYAYRDVEHSDWTPFVKAAVERNPVSIQMTGSMSIDEVYGWLEQMRNVSIYDGKRLAQPDEVANFQSGDGIEKAILLANVIRERGLEQDLEIIVEGSDVVLKGEKEYVFASTKGLEKRVRICAAGAIPVAE
ncbi:MAG: hypothetical protein ACYSUD_13565, partial [Planctomycetota bacterium]